MIIIIITSKQIIRLVTNELLLKIIIINHNKIELSSFDYNVPDALSATLSMIMSSSVHAELGLKLRYNNSYNIVPSAVKIQLYILFYI